MRNDEKRPHSHILPILDLHSFHPLSREFYRSASTSTANPTPCGLSCIACVRVDACRGLYKWELVIVCPAQVAREHTGARLTLLALARLEKRLSIALLLLLLAVLVFMTLTRGPRGEAVMVPSEESPRNVSSPKPAASKPKAPSGMSGHIHITEIRLTCVQRHPYAIKLDFPTTICTTSPPSTASKPKPPRLNMYGLVRPRSRTGSIGNKRAHSRTPPLTRAPHRDADARTHTRHAADDGGLHLQGSPASRNARRWARAAHMHELRSGASGRGSAQRLDVVPTSNDNA
ncbi:hypothetical protein C8R45DRAFT_1152902 [Mycena sanguinolenta]|nr:hypothetical protein C8R45DRAFT_1152902 [Mycena sanguinolenta]